MSAVPTTAEGETVRFYMTDADHHPEGGTMLGFWIYLMSDCLIFACLFACFAVYGHSFAAGPRPAEIFDLTTVAINTAMLLISSLTYGFAMLSMQDGRRDMVIVWLALTGMFGAAFVGLELNEFGHLIADGAGPQRSAFLSSFFTLVGTHGLHVSVGLIWLVVLMVQVSQRGLAPEIRRRLMCLSMFWHFLDVIWIGVFSVVYLVSVLP